MSKINIEFKDRIVEFPNRYSLTDNGDGTYTLIPFPGEVSEEGTPINAGNMNEIVSRHNALYDTVIPRLFSIPKRDVEGNVIYAVQAQDNPEQEHIYGTVTTTPGNGFFDFRTVTIAPSRKKRFLKITYDITTGYTSGTGGLISNFMLINITDSTTLKTTSVDETFKIYRPQTYTADYEVEADKTVSFKIRHEYIKTSGTAMDFRIYLRNFKIFCEDTEFTY
ncbi:MAG: hypothetical protein BWY15_02485 [Firmicutes bacterium ADurb.Bin193]|nr:MAG: hypothetical protein BWY15_02485 [Firmicutes bacterium ADurb.Bin193]